MPANPPREEFEDEYRVYPVDGIFYTVWYSQGFKRLGFKEFVSLQLFNPCCWEQDLHGVAKPVWKNTLKVNEENGVY